MAFIVLLKANDDGSIDTVTVLNIFLRECLGAGTLACMEIVILTRSDLR